jgi:predicted dinucleotide-binding enzyme
MGTPDTPIRIKVIGCGGIGGHLARNLCHFLYAERRPAHVSLVDGDAFEEKNRGRMRFTALENKAVVLARELARAFGGGSLTIEPIPEYVTPENVREIVGEGDVVLLAVDNHATRRLVGGAIADRRDVVIVSGGNDGVEPEQDRDGTYGNVQIVRRAAGAWTTNSLTAFHPEIEDAADALPTTLSCAELAQAGAPQLLFTNLAVASAMLNAFYALVHERIPYEEVYLDIARNRVTPIVRAVTAESREGPRC